MKVLVTGAAGLYGFFAVRELASKQTVSKVYGVDDFSRGYPREDDFMTRRWGEKVEIIRQKYQDFTVKEINSLNVDVVIHLAGYNSGRESINTPEEYFVNNEYGTFQFVQTLLRTRNQPFFIYVSTTEVYGSPLRSPVDENHPVNPQNIYAATKLAAEKHVLGAGRCLKYPVAAMRFTNTYGENHNICGYTSVVASFVDRALRNEPLIIYGSGEQERDFLYARDAANALYLAAVHRNSAENMVINIATGTLISVCGLAEKIIQLTGSLSEIIYLPCETAEPDGCRLDIGLAAKVLHWFPRTSLEEGLSKTIDWHKSIHSL